MAAMDIADGADIPPNQTIYINRLNEKIKKDGACPGAFPCLPPARPPARPAARRAVAARCASACVS
jgi:hypothetical protein